MGAFRLTPPLPVIIFPIFYEEKEKKKTRSLGWPGVLPSPWRHLTVSALPLSLISTQPVAVGTFTESGKATAMMALPPGSALKMRGAKTTPFLE